MSIEDKTKFDAFLERFSSKGNISNKNYHIIYEEMAKVLNKQLEKKQKEEQDKITKPKVRNKSFGKEQH